MTWDLIDAEDVTVGTDLGDDGKVESFSDWPDGRYVQLSGGRRLMICWGDDVIGRK